jgi:multidrug efflux pump subunit AcrA (membrane-fusion protein)
VPAWPFPTRLAAPVALAVLAGAGLVVAITTVGSPAAAGSAERTVTVKRGVVQSTVSGSGSLSPANQLDLNFGAAGEVRTIAVKPGQHVSAGQLLATIDPSSAEVDLAEAQATLQSARDALSSASSSGATTAAAATTAQAASAAPSGSGSGRSQASAGVSSGAAGSGAASGSGSGATSVASATAAVKSAELSVAKAEEALAATKLRAPMAGTIAAVDGAVGDTVGSGSSASASSGSADAGSAAADAGADAGASSGSSSAFITLAQVSRFRMDVSLSESDIGKVKVGQAATVTVNAVAGTELAAHVERVGVLASSSSGSGAVSYPVTLKLDQSASQLKAGMSATADIVVAQATGLVVPSQALTGSSVTLVRDGKRSEQTVQTGVVGESSTEVVSGLKAGDEVVVRSASAAAGASAGAGTSTATGAQGAGEARSFRRAGANGAFSGGAGLGGGGAVLVKPGGAP